ncbi:MAG: DivIVA domain-containing protein [Gemmatimonadota bacterium]
MPVTPADVRNKQFASTRLRPGYDEEEVDAFLDEVEAELERLLQENQELRAKLSEVMRGGAPAVPMLSSPLGDPEPEMMAPQPVLQPERRPEPVPAPSAADGMGTVARVLALAQQTADQAIADARREASETLGRARHEADEILGKARQQAEQLTSDARARAESLERDAQDQYRQALGSLTQQREELERRVDDLRAFEREYRNRLRAYLEGQLRDLDAGSAETGIFPDISAVPRQPSLPGRQFGAEREPAGRSADSQLSGQEQAAGSTAHPDRAVTRPARR